jgi:branched-chain amino acid transport system permease protein
MGDYLIHLATLACILTTAVVALQLLVRDTGLLSVAQAIFLAIGTYSIARIAVLLGLDTLITIPIAVVLAIVLSLAISVPSLRLYDDYFAIATFGLQMIAFGVLVNWVWATNGPLGVTGIPPISVAGLELRNPYIVFAVSAAVAGAAVAFCEAIHASRFGLILHAIKSDELFARSLGKPTYRVKIVVVAISAALASVAGVLYAHFLGFVDPSSFTLMDSILLLSMVVIGGTRPVGAAAGTFLLVFLPEGLRFLGLPSALAANLRQILYGVLLVVVIAFRPQGLFGSVGIGQQVRREESAR